ncbi:trihelix transcription factor ASR3-like isoform X2 [Corylus avellana]|uniref:trihelix transcription factor ASR3-like isoform X2 n=1 Tax=Corylus avellana TaxID=13451 RepID=UPI00286CAABC|nr:trihelix transcription factor ASR3-like isoform X2 [Corylus avellana]
MADPGGNSIMRDYRKGNWTPNETMILIEAKKMDDERRMKRSGDSEGRNKSGEPRWKWVEDYCWRKECLRSQNQCNDKWDNLMRDYKKVRDYERKMAEEKAGGSYWKIERNERKERNLPTNMSPQIYDALVDVVERKGVTHQRLVSAASSNPNSVFVSSIGQPSLPPLLQHHISAAPAPPLPLPSPPPLAAQPLPAALTYSQPMPTVDFETSEHSDSPAKRRRRGSGSGEEGTGGGGGGGNTNASISHEVGSAISRSASIIAEALQASEEREERRHRELLSLHERRLKIEESKTEISRQGVSGLVDAINKLADSIHSLASHSNQPPPK